VAGTAGRHRHRGDAAVAELYSWYRFQPQQHDAGTV